MANITMTASVLAVSLSFAMMSFRPYLRFATVEKDLVTLQEGEITAFQWGTKNALLSMKKEELATKRMQKFIDKWE